MLHTTERASKTVGRNIRVLSESPSGHKSPLTMQSEQLDVLKCHLEYREFYVMLFGTRRYLENVAHKIRTPSQNVTRITFNRGNWYSSNPIYLKHSHGECATDDSIFIELPSSFVPFDECQFSIHCWTSSLECLPLFPRTQMS